MINSGGHKETNFMNKSYKINFFLQFNHHLIKISIKI